MGKKIPMWQTVIIIGITIALLVYSIIFTEYSQLHIPLIISAIAAAAVAVANGWRWSFLEQGVIQSISRSMQSCLILLTVGILTGVWKAAGIIPSMIYYGLKIISPEIFLVTACVLCTIVALAIGSSWSVAGTVGVAMISIAVGLNIDPAIAAGAVVSGSYFGDKMSPLSDTTNLAPAIAGSNLFDHIKHMIWTVTPSMLIALILYGILGLGKGSGEVDLGSASILSDEIMAEFHISPILLIAPILLVVIVALRVPALPGLFGGVLIGLICMAVFQHIPPNMWFYTMHYGYETASTAVLSQNYTAADLLGGGGMNSMLQTVNLILCAMTFAGIMDCTGMLASLAESLLKVAKSTGTLVTVTIVSCFLVNLIASDQYLAIILPGRMYKEAFEDRRLKAKNLSRCLEDSGTITSALVPWNTCGASMSKFLGIGTLHYAPYAFLNWLNPLISIFYGFTGISMEKMTEAEYQNILEQRKMDAELAAKLME
ncbi:Na+/H+ antiporter NhaC [Bacilliculturomica massiliensis]|uniref:Na+/H+ antiporter NhaC n=1 Tax=Bacilliculturomica massiliensis TaxID=1917867 RepID=UPI0010320348|nr:Na+/H+ antiporter NhaC [Bacilliculturomica massiliensis]